MANELTFEERLRIAERYSGTRTVAYVTCNDGHIEAHETSDLYQVRLIVYSNDGKLIELTLERPHLEALARLVYNVRCNWREPLHYGLEAIDGAPPSERDINNE